MSLTAFAFQERLAASQVESQQSRREKNAPRDPSTRPRLRRGRLRMTEAVPLDFSEVQSPRTKNESDLRDFLKLFGKAAV